MRMIQALSLMSLLTACRAGSGTKGCGRQKRRRPPVFWPLLLRGRVVFWAGGISSSMAASYKLPAFMSRRCRAGALPVEAMNHYLRTF